MILRSKITESLWVHFFVGRVHPVRKYLKGPGGGEGGGSAGVPVDPSGNQDGNALQQAFIHGLDGNGGYLGGSGYLTVGNNGCTTIPSWYVGTHTHLTYGGGIGGDVVSE